MPVAQKLRDQGAPQPPPLRDADRLFGLDNLTQTEQIRVRLANEIYRTAVTIMECCFKANAFVILENPTRSWLWAILAALVKQSPNQALRDWYFQMRNADFLPVCTEAHVQSLRGYEHLANNCCNFKKSVITLMSTNSGPSHWKLIRGIFPGQQRRNILLCFQNELQQFLHQLHLQTLWHTLNFFLLAGCNGSLGYWQSLTKRE